MVMEITTPRSIFVAGSNLAGRHGLGAALHARKYYGAQYGVGVGRTGDAYMIPTKDENLKTLSIDRIRPYVKDFIQYAKDHPELEFNVTRVGCGLAGYNDKDMAPLFYGAPDNCLFVKEWDLILKEIEDNLSRRE